MFKHVHLMKDDLPFMDRTQRFKRALENVNAMQKIKRQHNLTEEEYHTLTEITDIVS